MRSNLYAKSVLKVPTLQPDAEEKLWRSCIGTNVPDNAVKGGYDSDEEPLYIGRIKHEAAVTPGKVKPFPNSKLNNAETVSR